MLIHKITKQNKLDKQKFIAEPIQSRRIQTKQPGMAELQWGGPVSGKAQSLWIESISS